MEDLEWRLFLSVTEPVSSPVSAAIPLDFRFLSFVDDEEEEDEDEEDFDLDDLDFLEDEDREDFGGSSSFLGVLLLESPFEEGVEEGAGDDVVLGSFEGDFGSGEEGPDDSKLITWGTEALGLPMEGTSDSTSSFSSSLLLLSISSSSSILLRGEFLMVCS